MYTLIYQVNKGTVECSFQFSSFILLSCTLCVTDAHSTLRIQFEHNNVYNYRYIRNESMNNI